MNPDKVNPGNFQVKGILYNNQDFSVAYGYWEKNELRVAMRWNGQGEDVGYPKTFGNPMWFIVDPAVAVPAVSSLLGLPDSDKAQILQALAVL